MAAECIGMNQPDGATFGLSASEKISFYGATTVVQPSSASQAAVTTSVTTTATTTALATDVAALIVLANQLRSELVSLGLIKGSA
jgi:hypothetical protein